MPQIILFSHETPIVIISTSQEGQTPLLLAIRKNDIVTVKELLASRADVDYIQEVV